MKFAKELARDATPEWHNHYLNYKVAKKKIKAVKKAYRGVPSLHRNSIVNTAGSSNRDASTRDAPVRSLLARGRRNTDAPLDALERQSSNRDQSARDAAGGLLLHERSPLQVDHKPKRMTSYGSIIGSPPHSPIVARKTQGAPSLELPAPAVEDDSDEPLSPGEDPKKGHTAPESSQMSHVGNAYRIQRPVDEIRTSSLQPQRTNSTPAETFRKLFGGAHGRESHQAGNKDVALEAYREVDFRQSDFFNFLDQELTKVSNFYVSKEEEAVERLNALREQLHIMREARLEEIIMESRARHQYAPSQSNGKSHAEDGRIAMNGDGDLKNKHLSTKDLVGGPIKKSFDLAGEALERIRRGHVGKTSKMMGELGTPTFGEPPNADYEARQRGDYVRRPIKDVSYRSAKRKMKNALTEYYRGLELVKSFGLLNHTAFRKTLKKYNKGMKAVGGRTTSYLEDQVQQAYFVKSQKIDELLETTEDLYARYFEKGNRKVAANKLRSRLRKKNYECSGALFRSGALLAAGAALAIQGTAYGFELLVHGHPAIPTDHTSYALQLYAGDFLMVFLALLVVCGCGWFQHTRVNYEMIMELDRRTALDWKQLLEIPSWLFFLLGITMYLNFSLVAGGSTMFIYWPVVLMGLSVLFLFCPGPVYYHHARAWFLNGVLRMSLSWTFLPRVNFREFFFGDLFCSLAYSMGNIELFFCLYARHWDGPAQCNSSHSRLLGFFSALPGVWRAVQCLRRFWDDHQAKGEWIIFPNLVNFGKYCFTILQYTTLSIWRIERTRANMAAFITMASCNTLYCITWDIVMDWSLFDLQHNLLREQLVYRKHIWMYYAAMVADIILRANWIFYVIFKDDLQHSTLVSFFVALSEVFRRGMWVLFRVENEQAANITRSIASKDRPLPYKLPASEEEDESEESEEAVAEPSTAPQTPSAAVAAKKSPEVERQSPAMNTLQRVGSVMRAAHTRDYERKRPQNDRAAAEEMAEEDELDDGDDGDDDDSDDE